MESLPPSRGSLILKMASAKQTECNLQELAVNADDISQALEISLRGQIKSANSLQQTDFHTVDRNGENDSDQSREEMDNLEEDPNYENSESEEINNSEEDQSYENSESEGEPDHDLPEPVTKKARKGQKNEKNWERRKNKDLRMKGEAYKGVKRTEGGKYVQDVDKQGRVLGPTCTSTFCQKSKTRNCDQFSEADRTLLHETFWQTMDWQQRKVYVSTLVDSVPPKQKTAGEESRRGATLIYNLKKREEKKQVCRNMFLSTLALKETQVKDWIKSSKSGMHLATQMQATPGRKSKKNDENRDHVKDFLTQLPKLPSHYCRASASKLYLLPPL